MTRRSLSVEPELCMAAGYCRKASPSLFGAADDSTVILHPHGEKTTGPVTVSDSHIEQAYEAVSLCPSGAIELLTIEES